MSRRKRDDARYRALTAAVEAELGDAVICARCGTDLAGFADRCTAMLDDPCEGFRKVDEVRTRKLRELLARHTTARIAAHAGAGPSRAKEGESDG